MDSRWSEALKTLDLVLLLQQPAKDKVVTTVRQNRVSDCADTQIEGEGETGSEGG